MSRASEQSRLWLPQHWPMWIGLGYFASPPACSLGPSSGISPAPWGGFVFHVIRLRRHIVMTNLRLCFPEKAESEILALARSHYDSLAVGLFEVCTGWWARAEDLPVHRIIGLEHLRAAEARGHGALLLTGPFYHAGNLRPPPDRRPRDGRALPRSEQSGVGPHHAWTARTPDDHRRAFRRPEGFGARAARRPFDLVRPRPGQAHAGLRDPALLRRAGHHQHRHEQDRQNDRRRRRSLFRPARAGRQLHPSRSIRRWSISPPRTPRAMRSASTACSRRISASPPSSTSGCTSASRPGDRDTRKRIDRCPRCPPRPTHPALRAPLFPEGTSAAWI